MSEENLEFSIGNKLDGDLPADAEVHEGQKPDATSADAEVEGRGHGHGHGHQHYIYVCCPHCHATNKVRHGTHYAHCWNCHHNFHV